MFIAALGLILPQAAPGPVVWSDAPPAIAGAPAPTPTTHRLPDWARADPFGYERSECSPMIRAAGETLEVCQVRVRAELASDLGDALPDGLRSTGAPDACRQEANGDRYALQCGAPSRAGPVSVPLEEQTCETRPQVQPRGGVAWTQDCRPASGAPAASDDGLKLRIGGRD